MRRAFRNIENHRVFDDDGRQGIDAITGLTSDTEIVCGRLLKQLRRDAMVVAPAG